jgi:hypothetical protein
MSGTKVVSIHKLHMLYLLQGCIKLTDFETVTSITMHFEPLKVLVRVCVRARMRVSVCVSE